MIYQQGDSSCAAGAMHVGSNQSQLAVVSTKSDKHTYTCYMLSHATQLVTAHNDNHSTQVLKPIAYFAPACYIKSNVSKRAQWESIVACIKADFSWDQSSNSSFSTNLL